MTVPHPGPRPADPRPADPRPAAAPEPEQVLAAAMAGLDRLADRPVAEHVEAFERVHAALTDALAAGSPSPG